jgi:hypothetical protein
VKACKHCDQFLPVRKHKVEDESDKAETAEYEDKSEIDNDENDENDEGPVGTGDFNVLPSWKIPTQCPFCKENLVLVERRARRCVVIFDPTREVQNLQAINNTIQDSAIAVPVLYEGQPYWTILFGTSLSMLLFLVVKEKQKLYKGSVAGIGPLLVFNTMTGINAICPPNNPTVKIDFSRKKQEEQW